MSVHPINPTITQADASAPREKPAFMLGDVNQNPPGLGFWALLREDLRTHGGAFLEQGFWAIAAHRFGNWRMGIRRRWLRLPFTVIYKILYRVVMWTCGISLPYTVKVGRRVRIWHFGGMVLHAKSIGDEVHIRQNTTFGIARRDQEFELPTIEDRVDVGAGAVIVGGITVGHDSVIGANAVVLKDVPPWSVAAGVPAKVVKTLEPARAGAEV